MSRDLINRLRGMAEDATDWNGGAMEEWDKIRRTVEGHKGSDLPRLMFEALMESFAELLKEAADALEKGSPIR